MDAGKFWNLSQNNTSKDENNFFSTRDTSKNALDNVSFTTSTTSTDTTSTGASTGGGWNISKTNIKDDPLPKGASASTKNISFAIGNAPSESTAIVKQATSESNKENVGSGGNDDEEEVKDEEYCAQLVALNKSVLEWIKKHVNKNPCIDLSPVIRDYESHLTALEEQFKARTQAKKLLTTPEPNHTSPATTSANKMMSFVSSTPINSDTSSGAKFPPAGFFSQPSTNLAPLKESTGAVAAGANAEDEDAPPVVERKTVVESDAFFQTRAKLFFKKGSSWQELGVGMLYLKPCDEQIQLLIRMESVTGKVLLNINISEESPVSRSGKNNVMVVSVPNPPVYLKPADGDNNVPCTYLVRVKDAQLADELHDKLKKK